MNCHELDNLLFPYLDGEFSASERAQLELHLTTCTACAARADRERLNLDTLRSALQQHSPPATQSLRDRVKGGLDAEDARARRAHLVPRLALAAAVLVAASVSWQNWRAYKTRAVADEAVSRHARNFPLEIHSASPEQLEEWFRGKLDHRVAVPRFPNAVAAGARLVSLDGKDSAQIVYASPQDLAARRTSLIVVGDTRGDIDVPDLPEVAITHSHGYNVVSARDGDLVYILTTDTTVDDVESLRAALRQGPRLAPPPQQVVPVSLER